MNESFRQVWEPNQIQQKIQLKTDSFTNWTDNGNISQSLKIFSEYEVSTCSSYKAL